jgi:hypothetical protein
VNWTQNLEGINCKIGGLRANLQIEFRFQGLGPKSIKELDCGLVYRKVRGLIANEAEI